MKKLLFIPLLAAVMSGYAATLPVTSFDVFGGYCICLEDYFYPGDTVRVSFRLLNCPASNDSVTFRIYNNGFTITDEYFIKVRISDQLWISRPNCNNTYQFKWVAPNLRPFVAFYVEIKNSTTTSQPPLFFVTQRTVTTDLTTDLNTEKPTYKFYSMQGIELPNEPESGFYIKETILNGRITRIKIYKNSL